MTAGAGLMWCDVRCTADQSLRLIPLAGGHLNRSQVNCFLVMVFAALASRKTNSVFCQMALWTNPCLLYPAGPIAQWLSMDEMYNWEPHCVTFIIFNYEVNNFHSFDRANEGTRNFELASPLFPHVWISAASPQSCKSSSFVPWAMPILSSHLKV